MKATSANPALLLFPASYRRRVLCLLLLHPERTLHVREIARLTGTAAGTLNKELARLHAAGLLTRESAGNQLRYAANRASPIYPELAVQRRAMACQGQGEGLVRPRRAGQAEDLPDRKRR